MTRSLVREASSLGTVAPDAGQQPGKFRIRIIEGDRWGSSGYWPSEVIKRDGPTVFASGTQIFMDHPTESEQWDRPERSVRDLAGIISSTPEWNEADKALEADATFFSAYASTIKEIAPHIGMSVNVWATQEAMDVGGQFGAVATALIAADSVDVVTKAGAGGAILKAIESARSKFLAGQPVSESAKESEIVAEVNDKLLSDLTTSLTTLTTILTTEAQARETQAVAAAEAAREAEEKAKPDPLELVGVLAEAKLPKAYQTRVIDAVRQGMESGAAVKAAQDELAQVLKEAGVSASAAPATPIGAPQGATGTGASGGTVSLPNGLMVDLSEARVNRALGKKVAS